MYITSYFTNVEGDRGAETRENRGGKREETEWDAGVMWGREEGEEWDIKFFNDFLVPF